MSEIEGCFNYTMHNEGWRNVNSSNTTIQQNSTSCDVRYLREGWHRFTGAAGTKIYTPGSCKSCGTRNPGWVSHGLYPSNPGESSILSLNFASRFDLRNNCDFVYRFSEAVVVRNCGDFYSHKFKTPPSQFGCEFRVCTTF